MPASLAGVRDLSSDNVGCGVPCEFIGMGSSEMVVGGGAGAGVTVLFSWATVLLLSRVLARTASLGCLVDGPPCRSTLGLLESERAALFLFGNYMP